MCFTPGLHHQRVLNDSVVRALATWQGAPVVLSLYLDVDGRRYPRPSDYAPHVDHLFRLARKEAEPYGKQGADVDVDLARVADWLEHDLNRTKTRGVALFAASAQGRFEVVELSVPVSDQVFVGPRADVAQLVGILTSASPALVVAIDNERSRLVHLDLGEVEEVEAPTDPVPRQVDTDVEIGSFERHSAELARRHHRRVARSVADDVEGRPVQHIVLSGPREAVAHLEEHLPPRVAALVSGRIALPMTSPLTDLALAANEVVREAHHQRQTALIDELGNRAAQGAAAVTGLSATSDALNARRVGTLVVEKGFEAAGGRCSDCDALVVGDGTCPSCGGTVLAVENVVDVAITQAFVHHLAVEWCEEGSLAALGRIGAFERR